jgi:hypothetical protein
MREVWHSAWSENYLKWSTFHDASACSHHLMVISTHHLTDGKAQRIRASGLPIAVHIARHDRLIAAWKQEDLCQALGARPIYSDGGHMGDCPDRAAYWRMILEHFQQAGPRQSTKATEEGD